VAEFGGTNEILLHLHEGPNIDRCFTDDLGTFEMSPTARSTWPFSISTRAHRAS
jgi:hypothetical protein